MARELSRGRQVKAAILLAVAAALLAAPLCAFAADARRGDEIYQDRCALCHGMDAPGPAPSLKGVVGRRAASMPGFIYTDALNSSGLVWTPQNLARFLAAPAAMAPGTAMSVTVPDAGEQADLIAYLASLK